MKYVHHIFAIIIVAMVTGCATDLEPGEQLYTGLKPIKYVDYEACEHFTTTQEEVDAALATAPNGALFGSSYYRTPFPYALWIYNGFHDSQSPVGQWLAKTFGNEPVILSNVNPELRVSVAENVLQNHGYFRGAVDYDIVYGKPKITGSDTVPRPRTAKIQYNVTPGQLFTFDTVTYRNFPQQTQQINYTENSLIRSGEPFNVATLDEERKRLFQLFRNHGYYNYQESYTTFLADTMKAPGKVQMQVQLTDSLPPEAMLKWVIGRNNVNIRRSYNEPLTDSISRSFVRRNADTLRQRTQQAPILTIHYGGQRSPIRPGVVLQDVRLRPGQLFSDDNYTESINRMVSKGIYSSASIEFKPRVNPDGTLYILPDSVRDTATGESRAGAGILDMTVNCVLDKPYDVTLQANYLGKTSGRMGPGASLSFAKRNAFRGGELLSLNLAANYEFQTGGEQTSSNSYEIAGDLTLSIPRLWLPSFLNPKRQRWQTTPQTILSISRETINRSGFFRRHILSSELTYSFQPTRQSRHQFTPIMVEYDRLAEMSDEYFNKIMESAIMMSSLNDYFLTKMRYQYTYSSPVHYINPIYWNVSVTESSNILALGYMAFGKKWNTKGKEAFKTPFAQFVKLETEWKKTWRVGEYSSLVAHVDAGVMKAYGNSDAAPFSEYFYVGGANSLRGFAARSIGPSAYHNDNSKYAYVTNVGDMKLVANIEYRPRLFGSLYGALFMDLGNIWNLSKDSKILSIENAGDDATGQSADDAIASMDNVLLGNASDGTLHADNFLKDLALNIGVGIRYDLDFFVLRLDWGIALHSPYSKHTNGYFNMPNFGKAQCLNFAIGYPF